MVAPVIPGLTDHRIPAILAAAAEAGATRAGYIVVRLPHAVKEIFQQWLADHAPGKSARVLDRIRQIRGGSLNVSEWGKRLKGEGLFADQLRAPLHRHRPPRRPQPRPSPALHRVLPSPRRRATESVLETRPILRSPSRPSMPAAPSSALTLGFDADDTLWHNEIIFEKVHERYRALLARYHDAATVDRTLFATEMRNLERYGYGVKGFTLSSIETAIQLTAGQISAEEIRQIVSLGQDMLAHPVDILDGVPETLAALAGQHRLLVITKGDLRDQERKLARSGLAAHFHHVEILSEKDEGSYAALFRRATPSTRAAS